MSSTKRSIIGATNGVDFLHILQVCSQQCSGVFEKRNVLVDPVPQMAIYNNRQSSRFDGLYGYYRN